MASLRLHDVARKLLGPERVPDPGEFILWRIVLFFATIAAMLAFYTLRGY
ncbi:MAG TPA: hypothetical protein VMT97_02275 [Terriglobales bacterium]|nr:hypothetical protein [Terriglobales bacterium]